MTPSCNRIQCIIVFLYVGILSVPAAEADKNTNAVQVKAKDGVAMTGALTPPAKSDKPIAVLIPGQNQTSDAFGGFPAKLVSKGYGILVYNSPRQVESQKTSAKTLNAGSADLDKFIASVKEQTGAKDPQILLIGAGSGANVAVDYAAQHPGIGGVISLSYQYTSATDNVASLDKLNQNKTNTLMVYSELSNDRSSSHSKQAYRRVKGTEARPRNSAQPESQMLLRQFGRNSGTSMLGQKEDDAILSWIDQFVDKSEKSEKDEDKKFVQPVTKETPAGATEIEAGTTLVF